MKWILLFSAIGFEVAGTMMMKLSEGFTKTYYSIGMMAAYIISLVFLTYSLKYFTEVSMVYAIWSGLGISLITILGIFIFSESVSLLKFIFIVMIVVGVIGLNYVTEHA